MEDTGLTVALIFTNQMASFNYQYSHPDWRQKRVQVFSERGKKCEKCTRTQNLEIHHVTYRNDRKVWEYPNSDLQVLCSECHSREHNRPTRQFCENQSCRANPRPEIERKFSLCYPCYRNISGRLEELESQCNRKIHEARDHYRRLAKNHKNLEQEKKAFKESLGERDELIERLMQDIEERDLLIEDLRLAYSEAMELLDKEKQKNKQYAQEIKKLKSLKAKLHKKSKVYQEEPAEEIDSLQRKLNAIESEIDQNKKKNNTEKKKYIALLDQKDKIIRELVFNQKVILKKHEEEISLSQKELTELTEQNQALEIQIDKYEEEIFELMRQLADEINENEKFMRNLIIILFIAVFGIILFLSNKPSEPVEINVEVVNPAQSKGKSDSHTENKSTPVFDINDPLAMEGQYVEEKLTIHQVNETDKRVILNIGGAFPDQKLALIIWDDDQGNFSTLEPFRQLEGQEVICKGKITAYKGQPQIILQKAHQLSLHDDS